MKEHLHQCQNHQGSQLAYEFATNFTHKLSTPPAIVSSFLWLHMMVFGRCNFRNCFSSSLRTCWSTCVPTIRQLRCAGDPMRRPSRLRRRTRRDAPHVDEPAVVYALIFRAVRVPSHQGQRGTHALRPGRQTVACSPPLGPMENGTTDVVSCGHSPVHVSSTMCSPNSYGACLLTPVVPQLHSPIQFASFQVMVVDRCW